MTEAMRSGSPRIAAWCAAAALYLAGAVAALAGPAILVGGTGSGSRLLQALADEYRKTARGGEVTVVDPPLGSGAAIKAVREGKVQVAISARPLEGDERGGELVEIAFAHTPFVFASRDGEHRGGFNLAQLEDVYAGRLGRWDNGTPIRLILRPAFDADTQVLRAISPGMEKAVNQALERKGMVSASSDMEALRMIEQTPGSLGTTTLGLIRLLNGEVRVLPVGGQMPSAKALADGGYPWFKALYLVFRKAPGAEVQAFVDFLQSPQASALLARTEHLPLSHGR